MTKKRLLLSRATCHAELGDAYEMYEKFARPTGKINRFPHKLWRFNVWLYLGRDADMDSKGMKCWLLVQQSGDRLKGKYISNIVNISMRKAIEIHLVEISWFWSHKHFEFLQKKIC